MGKEHFTIVGSKNILQLIERAGERIGFGRGQAFEDFLTFVRCALAGQTMEEEYLATIAKGYDKGNKGERGIDFVARAFAELIILMEKTDQDVLGDIFTGGVSYGEAGQFFTPASITDLMAEIVVDPDNTGARKSVCDPASGSGRCLLAIAKLHPHWKFTGQDIDHRCTQMTAINLGLRNVFGWAVWQDTLRLKVHRVYKIGFNLAGGVIQEIPVDQSPFHHNRPTPDPKETEPFSSDRNSNENSRQLDLFRSLMISTQASP